MNIKVYLLVALLCLGGFVRGQNLIVNPGFESYNPSGSGPYLEDVVYHWYAYFTTPDYYSTELWDPLLLQDYCGTLPRSGHAMAGGYQLGYFPGMPAYNREYIQGNLTVPLKANTRYYAEMYVKPLRKTPFINWAVGNLGMAFTRDHYEGAGVTDTYMIPEIPEVAYAGPPICDLTEWTRISGCFTASGGETKIIIGNFNKDTATGTALLAGAGDDDAYRMSYYLFDDLLLKEMPAAYIDPADTLSCRDSLVTLTAYPEGRQYQWSTGATTRSIRVSKAGVYTAAVRTPEGCVLQAAANVAVKHCGPVCPPLYMPNAFSPNGDGHNDHYRPMNTTDITGLTLSIYNRWGQRIYYGGTLAAQWDGTFNTRPCDAGTYFYQLRYRDCQGVAQTGKGSLTLLR